MEKICLEIPKDIFENANSVFDELGLDVNSAVRMFLKRVSQDKSIAFLLPQNRPHPFSCRFITNRITNCRFHPAL